MTEYVVSVRLKADGSGLVGESRMAAKEFAALTEQARRYSAAQTEQARIVAQRDQAGRRFLDGLRDEIRQLTLSESALLRYKTAQAGVLGSAGPLIAQLDALKKAQAALTEQARRYSAAQTEQARIVAQRDQAGRRFLDGLRDEIRQLTLSESALLRYKTAQAGVLGSAGPLIAQLDALKKAQAAQTAESDRAGASLLSLRGILPGVFGAAAIAGAVSFTRSLVEAGLAAQRVRQGLAFASGSPEAGAQSYQRLRATVYELGLDLDSSARSYMRFQAAAQGTALQGAQSERIFRAVAGATTVLGLSVSETDGVFQALQQMMSKGSVQAEELRGQLGERLPGAFQIAARAMGVTTGELGKLLEMGAVSAAEFLPKFAAEMERTFAQALPGATRSAQAEINRFGSAWTEMKQTLAESGVLSAVATRMSAIARATRDVNAALAEAKNEGTWEQFKVLVGGGMFHAAGAVERLGERPGVWMNGRWISQDERAAQGRNATALGQQARSAWEREAISPAANDAMIAGVMARAEALRKLDKATAEYLPKQEKMRREIADLEKNFSGKVPEADLQRAIAQVREHYGDEARRSALEASASEQKIAQDNARSALEILQSQHQRGLFTEREYLAQRLAMQRAALDSEEQTATRRLAIAKGPDKAKALGDLDEIANRRRLLNDQAVEDLEALREKEFRFAQALADVQREQHNQAVARAQAIHAEAEALEFQAKTVGMSKSEVEAATIAQLEYTRAIRESQGATEEELIALEDKIAALRRLYSANRWEESRQRDRENARARFEEEQRANEDIRRSLTDSLMRGFEAGEPFAKNFAKTVENLFKTMVLRPVIQAIVSPIASPIAAFGTGVAQRMMGSFGASQFGSALAPGAGAALYSTIPGVGGQQAAMLAAQTGEFGAAGFSLTAAAAGADTLATLAAAAPYAAAAVAALYALGAFSEDARPRNPWLSINTTGAGGSVGTLAATETDLRDSSPAFWAEAQKWLDQLPDRLKAAVDNLGMVFEPGTSAAQAWAAMQAQIVATAKALNLSTEEMKHLQSVAEQEAQVAQERLGLQGELNQLTMSAAQLEEQRIAALDESNRALARNIQQIKDQRAALETLLGGTTSLAAAVRDARAAIVGISDIVMAFAVEQAAAQQDLLAVQRAAAKSYGEFAASISDFLRTTKSPGAQFSELKDLFAVRATLVKGGDTESLGGLLDVARQLFDLAQSQSTSEIDFVRRTAGFRATLEDLEAGAKARATALTPTGRSPALSPTEQAIKDAQDRVTTATKNTADALALVAGMTWSQRTAMSGLTDEIVRYRAAQQGANDAIATLAGITGEAGADMLLGAADAHKLGLALGLTGESLTLFEVKIAETKTSIGDFSAWLVGVNTLGLGFTGTLDAVTLAGSSMIRAFADVDAALRGVITNLSAIQMPSWTPAPPPPAAAQEGWANGVYSSALGASYDATANVLTTVSGRSYSGAQVKAALDAAVDAGDLMGIYREAVGAGVSSAGLAALLSASGYSATQEQILRWTAANGLPSFASGTDFLPRDMMVQAHYGERITPAAYNRSDATNAELLAELRELRKELAAVKAEVAKTTTNTRKTSDTLVRVTRDGNALVTAAA